MKLRTSIAASALLLALTSALGCGSDDKPASSSASAAAATSAAPVKTSKPKSDGPPVVTVDDMGPYINGERVTLKEQGGPDKLKRIVSVLPKDKQLDLVVLKKAKTPDVIAVVRELGALGVPSIKLKADGRDDLPKELIIVPQARLTDKVAPCSVVAMVDKDLSTDVWPIQGGSGKKHSKGFAGPDLTLAGESLKKAIEKCDSSVAFFSADESLEWEMAHNIGGTLVKADDAKKIKTLVLLDEVPVPGRPVKVGP